MINSQSYGLEIYCGNDHWEQADAVGSLEYIEGYVSAVNATLPVMPPYRILHVPSGRVVRHCVGSLYASDKFSPPRWMRCVQNINGSKAEQ